MAGTYLKDVAVRTTTASWMLARLGSRSWTWKRHGRNCAPPFISPVLSGEGGQLQLLWCPHHRGPDQDAWGNSTPASWRGASLPDIETASNMTLRTWKSPPPQSNTFISTPVLFKLSLMHTLKEQMGGQFSLWFHLDYMWQINLIDRFVTSLLSVFADQENCCHQSYHLIYSLIYFPKHCAIMREGICWFNKAILLRS